MSTLRLAAGLAVLASLWSSPRCQDLYEESILRTLELRFAQQDWWQQLTNNYTSGVYIKADLTVGSSLWRDVGVRFRGNTSYTQVTSQKKPFEISMDAFVPGQELLGYHTINLNNGFRDPTFVKEPLCYWMFRQSMPAPMCNFVVLKINGESWGPYINVQQVNKRMLREHFRDDEGNRYRAELQNGAGVNDSALTWLGTDPNAYQRGYELKSEQSPAPWVDLRDLCDALNNAPANRFPADLARLLDIDEATRYLAGQSVVPALDSYIGNTSHNYYLFHDGWHGLFALIPWDLNAAWGGNNWLTVAQKVALDPFYVPTGAAQRPLVTRMLGDPGIRQRYLAHVRTLLDTLYDWRVLGPRVAALQAIVEPELAKDTKRLYGMDLFKTNVTQDVQIQVGLAQQWIPGIASMTNGRRQFLLAHSAVNQPAPALGAPRHAPAAPTIRDEAVVTVAATGSAGVGAVVLCWRTRGAWNEAPMLDDGDHGDGFAHDGVFGAAIPRQPYGTDVEYYVLAQSPQAQGGAMAMAPRSAGHRPNGYRVDWPRNPGAITINELVAKNQAGIRDENGEREDWFELHNASASPVDVGGSWLTDDLAVPKRWQIPARTTIGPGQTLLIWADEEPGDGALHATFKLAVEGETIALFAPDGFTLLDAVEFGPQTADVSTGRLYDGGAHWVTFASPTPGGRNAGLVCGHRVYSGLVPAAHELVLLGGPAAKIAGRVAWGIAGGPQLGTYLAVLAAAGGSTVVAPGLFAWLLADPLLGSLPVPADAQGSATVVIPVPDDPALLGFAVYGQAFALVAGRLQASNAIESVLCPK